MIEHYSSKIRRE